MRSKSVPPSERRARPVHVRRGRLRAPPRLVHQLVLHLGGALRDRRHGQPRQRHRLRRAALVERRLPRRRRTTRAILGQLELDHLQHNLHPTRPDRAQSTHGDYR